MISPAIAFCVWIPVALYCFRRFPTRLAILINFVGGWAVLPTAAYAASNTFFPYWILGSCLPASYFFTKASVTGMSGILGICLFDPRKLGEFKLSFWDLPALVWCTVPLLSGVANNQAFSLVGRNVLYKVLAWGVPYLLGRLYFSDTESLQLAAKAFVVAGLAYVPVCLLEIFTGPQIYSHLYGYQPYRWVGAQRYVGFRPVGLLEDGNQLGIWMATSALIAVWLWRRQTVNEILGVPIGWISCLLLVVTLLCQSGGSILILLSLLPFALWNQRYLLRTLTALLLLGILTFTGLRLTNAISLRSLVEENAVASSTLQFLRQIKRESLGWRLSQDEKHVGIALQKPLLGSAAWDWWKGETKRPWGLWLLSFGMYGMVGLVALESLMLIPVVRVAWFPSARSGLEDFDLRSALAAAIVISAIDHLLNSSMILPIVLVIGGLSSGSAAFPLEGEQIQNRAGRVLDPSQLDATIRPKIATAP